MEFNYEDNRKPFEWESELLQSWDKLFEHHASIRQQNQPSTAKTWESRVVEQKNYQFIDVIYYLQNRKKYLLKVIHYSPTANQNLQLLQLYIQVNTMILTNRNSILHNSVVYDIQFYRIRKHVSVPLFRASSRRSSSTRDRLNTAYSFVNFHDAKVRRVVIESLTEWNGGRKDGWSRKGPFWIRLLYAQLGELPFHLPIVERDGWDPLAIPGLRLADKYSL